MVWLLRAKFTRGPFYEATCLLNSRRVEHIHIGGIWCFCRIKKILICSTIVFTRLVALFINLFLIKFQFIMLQNKIITEHSGIFLTLSYGFGLKNVKLSDLTCIASVKPIFTMSSTT